MDLDSDLGAALTSTGWSRADSSTQSGILSGKRWINLLLCHMVGESDIVALDVLMVGC